MLLYQITIAIKEDKVGEFERNLSSLCKSFSRDKACLSYTGYLDFNAGNTFCIVGEFTTQGAMAKHFQTRNFEVLLGAASILGKSFKMIISEIVETGGVEMAKSKKGKHGSKN